MKSTEEKFNSSFHSRRLRRLSQVDYHFDIWPIQPLFVRLFFNPLLRVMLHFVHFLPAFRSASLDPKNANPLQHIEWAGTLLNSRNIMTDMCSETRCTSVGLVDIEQKWVFCKSRSVTADSASNIISAFLAQFTQVRGVCDERWGDGDIRTRKAVRV